MSRRSSRFSKQSNDAPEEIPSSSTTSFASSSSSPDPDHSGLLNLPTEIKAIIMEMLLRQDLAYKARTTYNASLRSPNFGRSLNVCFEVNREWSDLAAVEIYKTLPVSKIKHNTFKFIITRKRCDLFRKVDFDVKCNSRTTNEEAYGLLAILPFFTNISIISFKEVPVWLMKYQLGDTFGPTADNIVSLEIHNVAGLVHLDTISQLLSTFRQVKKISLGCDIFTNGLRNAIMSTRSLSVLELTARVVEEHQEDSVYDDTLTTLSLHLGIWDIKALSWLQLLPNLSHLSLDSVSEFSGTFPPLKLPNLTHLVINSTIVIPILSITSLFTSPITSLTIDRLSLKVCEYREVHTSIATLSRLRILSIVGSGMSLRTLRHLESWSQQHKFYLKYQSQEPMSNLHPSKPSKKVSDVDYVSAIGQEIYQTLDYARALMEEYEDNEDLTRTVELGAAIAKLRDIYNRDLKE